MSRKFIWVCPDLDQEPRTTKKELERWSCHFCKVMGYNRDGKCGGPTKYKRVEKHRR